MHGYSSVIQHNSACNWPLLHCIHAHVVHKVHHRCSCVHEMLCCIHCSFLHQTESRRAKDDSCGECNLMFDVLQITMYAT